MIKTRYILCKYYCFRINLMTDYTYLLSQVALLEKVTDSFSVSELTELLRNADIAVPLQAKKHVLCQLLVQPGAINYA